MNKKDCHKKKKSHGAHGYSLESHWDILDWVADSDAHAKILCLNYADLLGNFRHYTQLVDLLTNVPCMATIHPNLPGALGRDIGVLRYLLTAHTEQEGYMRKGWL